MPRSATYSDWGPGRSAFRGLAWIGGAIAWIAALVIGAVLALFFAATVVVILVMAAALALLAAAAVRARRTVRAPTDPELIEARHIGGHSWVAYGWDGRQ
jgi:cation transport ATPase